MKSSVSFLLLFFVATVCGADPVGTSWTYQGHLTHLAAPANGGFDFEFALFDDPVGAVPVAPPEFRPGVPVIEGVFTVELDFGPVAHEGVQLWLGVAVRPAGAGVLAPLAPRQKITAVPYATLAEFVPMHSIGAPEVDPAQVQLRIDAVCPPGHLVRAVEQTGDVVCAPDESGPGYVAGNGIAIVDDTIHAIDIDFTNELQALAINGNDLSITNGNTVALPISPGPWEFNGPDIYYDTGNVGINLSNPTEQFHLYGGNAKFEWFSGSVMISTPGSWPGFIGIEQSGKRRDIAFRDLGLHLGASADSSGISNDNGMWIRDGGNVGIRTFNPGDYPLLVHEPGSAGLGIQHSSGQLWELYVNSSADLILNRQGPTYRGTFSAATGVYSPASDRRLKKDIQPLPVALPGVLGLQPSSYVMKDDEFARSQIGFIAQDVELLYPELVVRNADDNSEESWLGLNYFGITTLAVKAIQEQQVIIEAQETRLRDQEARLRVLEARLEAWSERGRF